MKANSRPTIIDQTLHALNEARETALYYLNRYRFDPFMREEHTQQLNKINELIKQLKDIENE